MDPIVLFFIMGVVCSLARVDLKIPQAVYEGLCIYLLLAIGLKGGAELRGHPPLGLIDDIALVVLMGIFLPLLAFPLLRLGRLKRADAAAVAAHYGSVSIGTYAVAVGFLLERNVTFEGYMPLFVALLEVPALIVGVLLSKKRAGSETNWGKLLHEVFLGKSVFLLLGALVVGWLGGKGGLNQLAPFFVDPFKGVLCLFLLEMGLVAGQHLGGLRQYGRTIVLFGLGFPLIGAAVGAGVAAILGLSVGGATLLMTLAASASYIAAPAAMKMSVPEANPAMALVASLGITFPLNVLIGVPCYYAFAAAWLG